LLQDPATASPRLAIKGLKSDFECDHNPAVVYALEQTVLGSAATESEEEYEELVAADN
jgi:hypothetical protein